MPLLLPADYASVRRVLDTTLDADTLSDSVIADPLYQGAAEREVLARDPDAATRTGVEGEQIRAAAVLLTAARVAAAVPRATDVTLDRFAYRRPVPEWAALERKLRREAARALDAVVGPAPRSRQFVLARAGERAR